MKIFYIANIRIPTEKAHGIQIVKMCETLGSRGFDVTLVVPWRKNNTKEDVFRFYNIRKTFKVVTLPCIDLVWFGKYGFVIQSTVFAIFSAFYSILKKPDLVYSRHSSALFVLSLFSRLPFYYEVHVPRYNFSVKRVVTKSSKLIVISNGLKELMKERGVSSGKIIIAPSGVEISIFSTKLSIEEARKKIGLPKNKFVIGYTGSFKTMGYEKGLSMVFESLKKLDKDIIFLAVGGRPVDIETYSDLAREMGVADRVLLKERVSTREAALYQAACDVLAMPFPADVHYTRYMSPVKMFEYMAGCRPIVTSDLPSIREILNEETCFFFKPDDPADFARSVLEAKNNPAGAGNKCTKAFERVAQYTWQKRIDAIFSNF